MFTESSTSFELKINHNYIGMVLQKDLIHLNVVSGKITNKIFTENKMKNKKYHTVGAPS
jgi:hypothetical protein